jgi:hypothetical protein
VQYFAAASQKFTCPAGTAAPVEVLIEARRVTVLPQVTLVAATPPELTLREVAVETLVWAAARLDRPQSIARTAQEPALLKDPRRRSTSI